MNTETRLLCRPFEDSLDNVQEDVTLEDVDNHGEGDSEWWREWWRAALFFTSCLLSCPLANLIIQSSSI